MQKQSLRANGKLLLTGEYAVLFGARALAVPLSVGQSLEVQPRRLDRYLLWEAWYGQVLWFTARLRLPELLIDHSSDRFRANFLLRVLQSAVQLGGQVPEPANIVCRIDFSPEWGLGSSSSFIALVARWIGVDPFTLHQKVSKGSGYDVVCALSDHPLVFQRFNGGYVTEKVDFDSPVLSRLFLIYRNKKLPTEGHIEKVSGWETRLREAEGEISSLTGEWLNATSLEELGRITVLHEQLIASATGMKPVQQSLFPDFEGYIKSLGAWGGDFLLAFSPNGEAYLRNYFARQGYMVSFRYVDLIQSCHSGSSVNFGRQVVV